MFLLKTKILLGLGSTAVIGGVTGATVYYFSKKSDDKLEKKKAIIKPEEIFPPDHII